MTDTRTSINTEFGRRRELPLPVRAWVRLMRVYARIDRQSADRFRCHGLSVGRFDVINHAGRHDGSTQQDLADALLVTKGNVSQLIDSLERDGLLVRHKAGRCSHISLTPEGHALRERAMSDHLDGIADAMSPLSPDEQRTLLDLLRKLERGLDIRDASPLQ